MCIVDSYLFTITNYSIIFIIHFFTILINFKSW